MTLYSVQCVNPKNSAETSVVILVDRAAAEASSDWQLFVMNAARPHIPPEMMPIMGRVERVKAQ